MGNTSEHVIYLPSKCQRNAWLNLIKDSGTEVNKPIQQLLVGDVEIGRHFLNQNNLTSENLGASNSFTSTETFVTVVSDTSAHHTVCQDLEMNRNPRTTSSDGQVVHSRIAADTSVRQNEPVSKKLTGHTRTLEVFFSSNLLTS